jgi:hypothetical protein
MIDGQDEDPGSQQVVTEVGRLCYSVQKVVHVIAVQPRDDVRFRVKLAAVVSHSLHQMTRTKQK